MNKPLQKLTFKLAKPKTKKVSKGKPLTKMCYCICTKTDTEFKAIIRIVSESKRVTNLVIPFTLESYNCNGKIRVFTKKTDKRGKRVCHIRTADQAMLAPKRSVLYTPFCEDWVYSGHVVRIKGQLYFNIKEAIWHKDFVKQDLDIPESEIKL